MSQYTGPGLYVVVPQMSPDKVVAVAGGQSASGAAIMTWHGNQQTPNLYWNIVHASNDEYLFLSWDTGLYLCAAEGAGETGGLCTAKLISPKEKVARWKIIPSVDADGAGTYYIVNLGNKAVLNIQGAGTEAGTKLITWPKSPSNANRFWLKLPTQYVTAAASAGSGGNAALATGVGAEYLNVGSRGSNF